MIIDIKNHLGFNQYTLVDIDTGHKFIGYRYQLRRTDEIAAALLPDFNELIGSEEAETPETGAQNDGPEPSQDQPSDRWAMIEEEDIVNLAENRHSAHTAKQTKWAVSVFRGTNFTLLWRLLSHMYTPLELENHDNLH